MFSLFPLVAQAATDEETIAANNKKIQDFQKIIDNPSTYGANPAEVQALKNDIAALGTQNAQLAAKKAKLTTTILDKANKMCSPVIQACGCGSQPGLGGCVPSNNKYLCPCYDNPPPKHTVSGRCMAQNECRGDSFSGLDGKMQGVGDIGGIIGQIFKGLGDLLKGGGGGGGGAGSGGTGLSNGQPACAQYYQVTIPSTDPCAVYTPPTSGSSTSPGTSNASSLLLSALNAPEQSGATSESGTPTSVSGQIVSQLQESVGTSVPNAQTSPILSSELQQAATLPSGTRGDIEVTGAGATIFASSRDAQTNTEVVGFYGADTLGASQPQGLAARMCQSRPWADSFVSYVIPPTFFDGLCTWRGYPVGAQAVINAPSPTPIVSVQQTPSAPPATTATPVISTIKPEADIWAVPEKVQLGARTSIFWNTKGVSSCTITSADGNFSENTLSGGAATVPITGATIFTVSCLASDGTSVSDTTTVNLAI